MKRWGVFGIVLAVFLANILISLPAFAQDAETPARRLKISPLHTFIDVAPGVSYKGEVTLENTGSEPLSVSLSAEAFTVNNEQYDYTFLPTSPTSNWVHFTDSAFTLAPEEIRAIPYLVSVPITAEPGSAYISIFASSLPSMDSSIESIDRVGSLLYINIEGNTTKEGELLRFSAPWIHTNSLPWSATIRNGGTTHFNADYTISVSTLWGSTISQQTNSPLIFPRSVRLVSDAIEPPQWIGLYSLSYSFDLGDNETATGSQIFVYTPLTQLIPLLAIIVGVGFIIRNLVKKHSAKKNTSKKD